MSVALQTEYCHVCRGDVVSDHGRCPWCGTELLAIELERMPHAERRVSSDPFMKWAAEERRRLLAAARERGERIHNNDRGGRKLLDEIGISPAAWQIIRQNSLITVDRVAGLLAQAGVRFEDVYGPEPQIIWGKSPRRSPRGAPALRVTPSPVPGEDWEGIDRPDDAYKPTRPQPRRRRHTPRARQGALGLTDEQLRFAAEAYLCIPQIMYATRELDCRFGLCGYANFMALYQAVQGHLHSMGWVADRGKLERDLAARRLRPDAKPFRVRTSRLPELPEWLVQEAAWRYYYDQWGFQRLGRYFYPPVKTLYTRPQQLEQVIYSEFKRRGWPRRNRVEATRIASFKHGLAARDRYTRPRAEGETPYRQWLRHQRGLARPQCEGVAKSTGKRCLRAAKIGSTVCPQHDRSRQAELTAHMDRMRAISRATEVPAEPFAVWLDHKRAEFKTQKEMAVRVAELVGVTYQSVQAMIALVRKRSRARVRRETVERFLVALGGGSDYERGLREQTSEATGLAMSERVTFEDLYGPYVRETQGD